MLVNLRVEFHVGEGALERKEVNGQRSGRFRLQDQLVRELAIVGLMRISLAVVYSRLHGPLMVEGGEARRLIKQLLHVFIRSVGFHLQIIEDDLLVAEQIHECGIELLLLLELGVLSLKGSHHFSATFFRVRTNLLVLQRLVHRPVPTATNARVLATGRSLLALVHFMTFQRFTWELFVAVLRRNIRLDWSSKPP